MAGAKTIIVEVFPDGSSKVEAQNFVGAACDKATQAIELALAGSDGDIDKKRKPDFFQAVGSSQKATK
jgi:hypothetical protein